MNKEAAFALVLFAQAGLSATLPLAFEANRGQTDSRVRYLARGSQATLWLTEEEVVLGSAQEPLRIRFQGGNPKPPMQAEDALPGKANYFIGNQASRWRQDIPLFGKVRYRGVYPGIDAVFYGNPQELEYDLVVAPGADPRRIRLTYAGAKRMRIDATGDLILTVGSSEIRQHRPGIYQGTQAIEGRYALLGRNSIGFSIAAYDRKRPLTIDPVLTYATYLGGSASDYAESIAMDAQGNLYVTGNASSADFPIAGGVNQPAPNANLNLVVYLAKINPSASGAASLVWSTFLGSGTLGTLVSGVALDASGNIYTAGVTLSSFDFPATANAFQKSANCVGGTIANCSSGWVAKVAPGGNQLLYSSFLGGGIVDGVFGIAVDAAGNAYLAGATNSPLFPVRGAPYQSTYLGATPFLSGNGFLSVVSPDGSSLLYSTFFGGEGVDYLNSVALDYHGFVYVGGQTTSTRFPVTQNAYQNSLQGAATTGVLAKFDLTQPGASGLLYSSYIGGPNFFSSVNAVTVDSTGSIFAAGSTTDPNFPVTGGAFQGKYGGADPKDSSATGLSGDAFVLKLNPSAQGLAQLTYSSFFGGSGNEAASAIAIDGSGRIAIAGETSSSNLPITADAYECCYSNPGSSSGFLARIDPAKSGVSSLLYSTYLGGGTVGAAFLHGLAMNSAGTVAAVAGAIQSNGFPVPSSAFQKQIAKNNSFNSYVARFDLTAAGPVIASAVNAASFLATGFSPGLIFTLTGSGLGPAVGAGPQLDANGRVATTLAGTQVMVDGVAAPLLYVSAGQINAVAPYELAAKNGTTVFAQVISSGIAGSVFPVNVTDTAPGLFSAAGGQGAILNQDGSYNTAGNPAPKGTYIAIFLTGEGQTNPPGVDGHIATEPLAGLARPVATVGVKIGGVAVAPADIAYAGAAPQNVAGLLQVTVKVPATAASGSVPVVVTIGSHGSQNGVTVAVQ
jgi:uncharacterized protein (TIGR03437 family)